MTAVTHGGELRIGQAGRLALRGYFGKKPFEEAEQACARLTRARELARRFRPRGRPRDVLA